MQTRTEHLLPTPLSLRERVKQVEKEIIRETYRATGNNQSLTAKLLKMSRTALRYKLAEYEITQNE